MIQDRHLKDESFDRVYAIGDIHGYLDLLLDLESRIKADLVERPVPRAAICYLGDYVDRGPDSRGVIEHLIHPADDGVARIHLMGNHEDRLVGFLHDPMLGDAWFGYGAAQAMASYGVAASDRPSIADLPRLHKALNAAMPAEHKQFLETLALSLTWHRYFFVHAGVRPGRPLEAQDRDDLLWIREPFLSSDADFGKCVVHGHNVHPAPVIKRNRIGIDTSAYRYGRLTCLAAGLDEIKLLQSLTPT